MTALASEAPVAAPRQAARGRYDAVLDFAPARGIPAVAYVIVKRTFEVGNGRCIPVAPVPLAHDLRDDNLKPRIPVGSDFWFQKQRTDVVVQGSALALGGRPVSQMNVTVAVGARKKRITVFGDRRLDWRKDGTPAIPGPEPFTEMPLTYANAFGGIDARMPMPPPANPEELLKFDLFDHPGLYPRNLHGKGYLVLPEALPGALLPNLENPSDLLTDDRLVIRDPALWYRQPLPWCFDWTNPLMFPRMATLGLAPRFPPPADRSLPEIALGLLAPTFVEDYRTRFEAEDDLPAAYYEEASTGMSWPGLVAGTPMVVEGMHAELRRLEWRLPPAPSIDVFMAGERVGVKVMLSNCVIKPNEKRMSLVHVAIVHEMPRVFIPGVHRAIAFHAVIDGDRPLVYQPPLPVLDVLEAAQRRAAAEMGI